MGEGGCRTARQQSAILIHSSGWSYSAAADTCSWGLQPNVKGPATVKVQGGQGGRREEGGGGWERKGVQGEGR